MKAKLKKDCVASRIALCRSQGLSSFLDARIDKQLSEHIKELAGAELIDQRVKKLAREISLAAGEKPLSVLSVLDDSFVFLADLLRVITVPVRTSFLRFDHRSLGGIVDLSFITRVDVRGLDLLLVAGVLDTGITQEYVARQLEAHGAVTVSHCVLVDKPSRRRADVEPKWCAFKLNDENVFGYGLGYEDRFRELPFLATFA